MKDVILENFRPDVYSTLSNEEKKEVILQTIKSIQEENDLSEIDIEFSDGLFGFDFSKRKAIIDLSCSDSYAELTGIIHELRHQWQSEKKGLVPVNGSGRDYILSSHESDAHEYAIKEMEKYQDFFNDDRFDMYLLKLKGDYFKKKNSARYTYERSGYSDIEEISRRMSLYKEQAAIFSDEEIRENGEAKTMPFESDNGIIGMFKLNASNQNIFLGIPGISGTLKGTDLYIMGFSVGKEITTDNFIKVLQLYMDCLHEFKDIGINVHCDSIHFPPAIVGGGGLPKNMYEAFLGSLHCGEDRTISVENINLGKFDGNFVLKNTIGMMSDGLELKFGIDYNKKYTKEQIAIFMKAVEWEINLEELTIDREENGEDEMSMNNGFFSLYQYKKEYSPRKLALILAGQKRGLNTFYYDSLNEEQIEQLMILQLEGFNKEDWISLVQDGADFEKCRQRLEQGKNGITIIQGISLDADCNISNSDSPEIFSASDISSALQTTARDGVASKVQSDLVNFAQNTNQKEEVPKKE